MAWKSQQTELHVRRWEIRVRKYNLCFLKPQVFFIPNIAYMTCITNSKYLGPSTLQNNYLTISPQTLTVGSLLSPCNVQESQKLTQCKGEELASTFETVRVQFDWSISASVSPSHVLSLGSCPTQGVPVLAMRMPDPLLQPVSQARFLSAPGHSTSLVQRPWEHRFRKVTNMLEVQGKATLKDLEIPR